MVTESVGANRYYVRALDSNGEYCLNGTEEPAQPPKCVDVTLRYHFRDGLLEGKDYFNDDVVYYRGLVQVRIAAEKKNAPAATPACPASSPEQSAYKPC